MAGFRGKALLVLGGGPEQIPLIRRAQALNKYEGEWQHGVRCGNGISLVSLFVPPYLEWS